MLIDSHCHLDADRFPEGVDEVIGRAHSAGVGAFVCIGVGGHEAAAAAVALAERRRDVVATVGVHPHDAAGCDAALFERIEQLARAERVVAVGEIGLDHYYEHSPRPVQLEVFRRFIALGRALGKPVVIHTRDAPEETLAVLEEESARDVGGVIHCFSEDREFARRALDLGFDLSFSGIVTFKNARSIREVAGWAPEERILVETDSPYLAPVPLRGKRNEPAFVTHTARVVAELRGVAPEALGRTTTANACRRFGPLLAAALAAGQTFALADR